MEISSIQFATFWQRFAARIIDGLVLSVLSMAFYYMAGFDEGVSYDVQTNRYNRMQIFISVSNFLLFYVLYYPFFEANGGTIGKRVFSIAPVAVDSMKTISLGQAYKRSLALIWPVFALIAVLLYASYANHFLESTFNFVMVMWIVFGAVGPLAMIWSSRKQGWHDAWADTVVVKSGKSRKRRDLEELVEE
ncbi:MAG: RDD family protein [Bacteroidota bacterium]|jgi:uncharacterized RDD family membrane protein YckC